MGEQRSGVFFFKDVQPDAISMDHAAIRDLWHCRLGHPYDQAMSLFSNNIGSYNKDHCDKCYVYFRAKQTHLSFSISESKATNCFDLIHCYIWDAYQTESLTGAHYFLSIIVTLARGP